MTDALLAAGESPAEILARLVIEDAVEVAADGAVRSTSAVYEPERTSVGWGPVVEPTSAVDALAETLDNAAALAPDEKVVIQATIHRAWLGMEGTFATYLYEEMIAGTVLTEGDVVDCKADWLAAREAAGAVAVDDVAKVVEAMGGELTDAAPLSGTIEFVIAAGSLEKLVEALPQLSTMTVASSADYEVETLKDAGYGYAVTGTTIDGLELENLLQSGQFYDDSYFGISKLGFSESWQFAVFKRHPGLLDYPSSASRVENVAQYFWQDEDPDVGSSHHTAVASVAIGDVSLGQDTYPSGSLEARKRSGVARRATAIAVYWNPISWLESVFLSSTYDLTLTSVSDSDDGADPLCLGATSRSRSWNAMFEGGLAMFKSAGNDYVTDIHDCTIGSPGSAIGAFAVGAYEVDSNNQEVTEPNQSRGGTDVQGRGRTIVALQGPSRMQYPYPHYMWPTDSSGTSYLHYGADWDGNGVGGDDFTKTSASTPAVAGAAELFRQWYRAERGSAVDDPGILYANMLLMGDRVDSGGGSMSTAFDNLTGAGRLRLRKYDAEGMDDPARHATGTFCIAQGEDVVIDITPSGPLDSDVDIIKAVGWWYDHRHDDLIDNDEILLRLVKYPGGGSTTIVVEDHTQDNRARVVLDNPDTQVKWKLHFQGVAVSADDEGCGTDRARIYYAYLWEDSDRDDSGSYLDYVRPE